MSNLLIKNTELGIEKIFPKNYILNLIDKDSGKSLQLILNSFNMLFLSYAGNKAETRKQIPLSLRKLGLWITYVIGKTVVIEWYNSNAIDDNTWGSNTYWMLGSNMLVGDITISSQGTWVVNGEDTGISPKGDKGDSPLIRIYNNKILVSYDKGVTYLDLNNTPVYTKFRFNSLTNTYLVSYDLGATWEDISDEKVYHKFRYNQSTNTYQESFDFGKTWSNISAEKVYTKFKFNRNTNTYQVSTDLGLNWTDVSSDKVYYLFRYNGETNTHLVSTDFGATWTNVSEDKVFYLFRTNDNRLLVSTDLGTTWENCSEPIAAWFRWADVNGTGNIGKIQISRDLQTWSDLSPIIANNLYIKGYVTAVGNLPSDAAIGDIYMVGPTYDESDTTLDYPHYRMWVKLSSGWVDNGEFTSIAAGVVQETGDSEAQVMSQKAVTEKISELGSKIEGTNNYHRYQITAGKDFYVGISNNYTIEKGQVIKFGVYPENAEITEYGIGTINGYYFGGLGSISNYPDTQYSYSITDAMYQYMVDANNYSLFLYIPGNNIITSGYITLEIKYNYSESIKYLLESNTKIINKNSEALSKVIPLVNTNRLDLRGDTIEIPKNTEIYYYIDINKGDIITLRNNYTYNLSYLINCRLINEDNTKLDLTLLNGGKEIQITSDKKYKGFIFNANENNTITIGYNNNSLPANKTIISDIRELKGKIENLTIPESELSFEYDGVKLTPQSYAIKAGVTYECYFLANNQWAVSTYDENNKIVEEAVVTLSSSEYGYFTATKNACFVGGFTNANTAGTFSIKVSDVQNGIKTKYREEYNTYILEKKQVPTITKFDNLHVISISNQSDFDNIHTIINNSVAQGYKNIAICFPSDTFFYSEKHFNLTSNVYSSCEDVNLHLFGLNTKIIPKGVTYNHKNAEGIFNGYYKYPCADKYNYKDLFIDKNGNEISTYGEVKYAESAVETVDAESSYYRFKLAFEDKDKYASYVKLSAWYTSAYEEVDKIEDGYVYFYQRQTNTSINGDNDFPKINYGISRQIYPRYKLLNSTDSNIYLKDGYLYVKCSIEEVIYCKSKKFLELQDTFNSLTISGFIFKGSVGSSDFYYHAETQPVGFINIDAFEGEFVNISNNEFNCLKDFAIRVSNNSASNIIINDNKCFNNYRGLVIGTSTSRNIFAINNECINNGIYAYYEGIFTMSGKNFLISNNKIVDFPYAAIRSGAEYPGEGNETEGIIENNYIKLSNKYVAESYKHCLMDQGSIYVYGKVEKLIIRHNIIINSTGQYLNNGIMIDGYASNCKIIGNIILGTSGKGINRSILAYKKKNEETSATNNFIMYNIIDTKYRFTGWEGCIKGINILLRTDKTESLQNDIDVPNFEKDYQIFNVIRKGDAYLIPARYEFALYKFLTINPVIGSYIRFSNFN